MGMEVLQQNERLLLSTYESIVKKGRDSFIEVGNALMRIRDGRLYRETHNRFEDYCQEKWELSKRYVNRLVAASEIAEEMGPMGPKPKSERQVRPLAELETKEERADAWKEAVETAPKDKSGEPVVTAKHVAEVVERRAPRSDASGDAAKINVVTDWHKLEQMNLRSRAFFESLVAERKDNAKSEAVLNLYEELEGAIEAYRKSVQRKEG